MIPFIASVAVFVAIALAFLLPPLLRKYAPATTDITSLPIHREQLQELQADFANGSILEAQFREAEQELKHRLLEETRARATPISDGTRRRWIAAAIALALPLGSFALYKLLGQPEAFVALANHSGAAINAENITPQHFATMTQRLAVRLRQQPNDVHGWTMLAKAYLALGRGNDAIMAYDRAVLLAPDNATLLAEYAHALATGNNNSFAGRPREIVAQGLKLEPNNPRILALAGSAAFEGKDFSAAIGYWEKLLAQVPKESEITDEIVASINAARAASGQTPTADANASVSGTVRLSDSLKDKAAAGDTLFIYARAAGRNAPKMPLAVWRGAVKDLPKTFTLDDSMAMTPAMVLSKFEQVTVEARVSKSGNAIPQSGDLSGAGVIVKPGAKNIKILIDRVVP
ncbi:MAG: c-type cytochrome biogenesis protein CcmI [Pseudomonadota bacterium]|nr:c-type cytochrome biogenesis protein CcmI [Pseudomonadota bacterium]